MLAGHFTTALIARQREPRGHLAYYLVASQLPDLLWLGFHYLGLEPTHPDNFMNVSLDTMHVHMTYSHDLLPTLGWIALVVVAGRLLFGSLRPGLIGGALMVVHAVTDYVGGFPHHVFGPDSPAVGTGLYRSSPYFAVALEALFILGTMAWVLHADRRAGVRRSRATLRTWAAVFGGGVAFMFSSADLSMAELLGRQAPDALSGTFVPLMVVTYLGMMAALLWADGAPVQRTRRAPVAPTDGRGLSSEPG